MPESGSSRMYCVDEVLSMFERNSFSELEMSSSSSSGDEVLDLSEPDVEKFEELHISEDESMSDQDIQLPLFDEELSQSNEESHESIEICEERSSDSDRYYSITFDNFLLLYNNIAEGEAQESLVDVNQEEDKEDMEEEVWGGFRKTARKGYMER